MKRTFVCCLILGCMWIAVPGATLADDSRSAADRHPQAASSQGRTDSGRYLRSRVSPWPWNPIELITSPDPRDLAPEVLPGEIETLINGSTAFALDVYGNIRGEGGNLFFSPYSITNALGMTYAGARGRTARQMAETLHFGLTPDRVHPAFNALDLELAGRGIGVPADPPRIIVANALWGQRGFAFEDDFLNILAAHYGAGLRTVDFASNPGQVAGLINEWIADHTDGEIDDLIKDGDLSPLTRFAVTNAIYFKASWQHPFSGLTAPRDFRLIDGGIIQIPTMRSEMFVGYVEGEAYEAIELPYVGGDLSMVLIAPDLGEFTRFELELTTGRLKDILSGLETRRVMLSLPKFDFDYPLNLRKTLTDLGMGVTFSPLADFSGISPSDSLHLSAALHQAFVAVDEVGTSAGAATAVVGGIISVPPPVEIDRPFVFMIRDRPTGAILFLGRVIDPSGH